MKKANPCTCGGRWIVVEKVYTASGRGVGPERDLRDTTAWAAHCTACGFGGKPAATKEGAIELWNQQ